MDTKSLKNYAPEARKKFIEAVTMKARTYGLTAKKVSQVTEKGDFSTPTARIVRNRTLSVSSKPAILTVRQWPMIWIYRKTILKLWWSYLRMRKHLVRWYGYHPNLQKNLRQCKNICVRY